MFLFTYTALGFSAIMAILFFTVLIMARHQHTVVARFLSANILAGIVWVISNAAADLSQKPGVLIFWSGLALIGAYFFVSTYLCFIEVFIAGKLTRIWLLGVYLFPSAAVSLFAFSHFSVMDTFFPPGVPAQILPGVLYNIYIPFLFLSILFASIKLILAYRTSGVVKRKQLLYLQVGFLLVFFGTCVFDVVLPLRGELRFFTLGPQFIIFFIALAVYAIFKHRLFDIRVAIQKSLIYTTLLALIVGVYLLILYIALYVLNGSHSRQIYFVASAVTAIVGIFGVPPLGKYFRKVTDRWFYQDAYDYPEAIHELSEVLNQTLELSQLRASIETTLKRILKVDSVDLRLIDGPTVPAVRRGSSHSVEIKLSSKLIGYLDIGKKLSGDALRPADNELLKTFANQAAVALEKARLFGEVSKHSKELEQKVAERTATLQRLQEGQRKMIIDISHALQTPLTVIKNQLYSAAGKRHPEPDPALEKSVDDLSKFVYDLLKLSRLETETGKPSFKPVQLSELAEEVAEYFGVLASAQNVIFTYAIAPDIIIEGDAKKLEELLANLLSNALKYIANERIVHLSLQKTGTMATITIQDSGIGISKNELPNIFDRFYRAHPENSQIGTGLGLSICREIVEQHHGTISAESIPKKGTTFFVSLPLAGQA